MKFIYTTLFCLISFCVSAQQPIYQYLDNFSVKDTTQSKLTGPARFIIKDGRKGINFTSIRSVLQLKAHNMRSPHGTVSIWMMPLEDLSTYDTKPNMSKSNPLFYTYSFLSDSPNPQDYDHANFKLAWTPRWHPSLTALFAKGSFYEEAFNLPHKALVSVSHLTFKQNTWYQLTLSWDYEHDKYALYLNGILISKENQYNPAKFKRDSIGKSLYLGNPTLCFSTIKFYNTVLTEAEVYKLFRKDCISFNQQLEDELKYTYAGLNKRKFEFAPDAGWQKKLDIRFNKPSDMDSFYVQGHPVKVGIVNDGMLIETINKLYTGSRLDSQVYVWSKKPFEGDLYVEYEFKVLRPGGLSLLMVQASGMNREDFMADYPLRTGGRMTTVYGEDVRNYHWEYYREMADMRNDIANSALMKNPFLYPLSFSALNAPVPKDTWQKLQFLQVGNKLIGAVNGIIMVEYTDDGFSNNGPVYNFGRIAIRCMLNSKLVFRNLKVYNRKTFDTEGITK